MKLGLALHHWAGHGHLCRLLLRFRKLVRNQDGRSRVPDAGGVGLWLRRRRFQLPRHLVMGKDALGR